MLALRVVGVLSVILALVFRASASDPYNTTSRTLYGSTTLGALVLAILTTVELALGTLTQLGWLNIVVFAFVALVSGLWFMRSLTRRKQAN